MSSIQATPTSSRKRIRQALKRYTGKLSADDRPLFESFVDHTISRLRGPFLAQHHPKQVLAYLEGAFSFARKRTQDDLHIEVRPGTTKGAVTLVNMVDQPFIVDTVRLFLRGHGADYWGGFNLVFQSRRDDDGNLIEIGPSEGAVTESLVLLESDAGGLFRDVPKLNAELKHNLSLAQAMVRDFRVMTRTVERCSDKMAAQADRSPDKADAFQETERFMQWMLRENFVFMGTELISGDESRRAGIQTIDGPLFGEITGDWPAPHAPGLVKVRKSNTESPVHRSGRIDELLIDLPNGDQLFVRGMFTYRAVTQPSRNVPILRGVLGSILAEQESKPGSYRYKGIANVFDSLPTEFIFTATRDAVGQMVDLVFESEQQQEVGVTFLMIGPTSAFCLVAMPKSQFSDDLRQLIQDEIIGSVQATYTDHGLFVGRYDTVLLHYYLTGVATQSQKTLLALSEHIRSIATPWIARLWSVLANRFDEPIADRLAETYGNAFPKEWVRNTSAERAVRDIEHLEALGGRRHPLADVYEDRERNLVLRMYEPVDLYLSDILPVLQDFGIVVIDSFATPVTSRGGHLHLDTFRIAGAEGVSHKEFLERSNLLVDALVAVFAGQVETDALSRLVLTAGLSWREVDVIRAYTRYSRQLQRRVAPSRAQEIVLGRPKLCAALVAHFTARFDPELDDDRAGLMAIASEKVNDKLRLIRAHDEDLVFSTLNQLITGTLRTNAYRDDRKFHYLSFKIDVQNVPIYVGARHLYEIFVHNKDVEGVHIRFGPVARGGLRWSDRDDYRTEVLSLATTQQKKNVVIVPEGAKGGFFLHNASKDRQKRREEADLHYKTFIRGLLDLTDNAVGGVKTRPPQVYCHDDFDPYLVVAADKGTAHLSDTANRLSLEYGFWLGDAFASGGSNGYDHKAVGITARGAWVLVKRHFAEMGVDPYSEPFTCAGVGDMGGDVFGNGLIETPQARLLAAFNHLHIFLDPNPDTKKAAAERKRLFKVAGGKAGWSSYKTSLISKGGGVFERASKTIPLSEQVQAMLGLPVDEASPEVVVHHILMMNVDLLWSGGIGTYVKASYQSQEDADDRSNNDVRVDATELNARILGEGGNLGMTQDARIEAGLHGVRLNTDAIDNSAGVDMSDHEVNLKILLDAVQQRGDLNIKQRNELLESLTDEVADLVLANNDAHGRQISRDIIRSKQDIFQFGRAIAFVEQVFGISRAELNLPTHRVLMERAAEQQGLTRPELAVLGAYVKMYVYKALIDGNPKKVPGYKSMLRNYFPKPIQKAYASDVTGHMLADEIAMTVATTRVIADAGCAFIPIMLETTGSNVPAIVTALLKSQKLARTEKSRATLEELRSSVNLDALYASWVKLVEGCRMVALYWLSARGRVPSDKELAAMLEAVDEVYARQSKTEAKRNLARIAELVSEGVPEAVASDVLKAQYLNIALMVWSEARRTDSELPEMIVRNVAVGRASGLLNIIDGLAGRPASGQWEPIALQILYIRYLQLLRSLVVRVEVEGECNSVDELQPVLEAGPLRAVRSQVDALLGAEEEPSVATLLVLEERVAAAIARLGS